MTDELFYDECARLLGTTHDYLPFTHYKRTRWNNRTPGSGRYPGYGIIRMFGNQIQVSLRHPVCHQKIYHSKQEVLDFLKSIYDN